MQIKQRVTKTIAYDLKLRHTTLNCLTEYRLTVLVILISLQNIFTHYNIIILKFVTKLKKM